MAIIACGSGVRCIESNVTWTFSSSSKEFVYLRGDQRLYVTVGEARGSDPMEYSNDVSLSGVTETLTLTLPFRAFKHIAEAPNVSGSLGSTELNLSYERRDAFRQFVRAVERADSTLALRR